MKEIRFLISAGFALALSTLTNAAVIFTESFGSVSSTTSFSTHTTNSGFDNDAFSFSGTGDLRSTTVSTGYTGASGGANAFFTNNGSASLTISGISTLGYVSGSFELSFGAHKNTIASDLTELVLQWQVTGAETWNTISFSAQPTGSGTTGWRLISVTGIALAVDDDISLRFTNTSSTPQFRVDDVILSATAVPEPSTYTAIAGALVLAGVMVRRRRRA